jgi:hypothetical protein
MPPPIALKDRKGKARKRSVKNSDTSPVTIRFRERAKEALDYRKQGYTFPEIGKVMKCDASYAHRMVKWAMDQILAVSVDEYRHLQNQRLDALLTAVMAAAVSGDVPALQNALKVMAEQSKLNGLYAPTKLEHSGEITNSGPPIFIIRQEDADL